MMERPTARQSRLTVVPCTISDAQAFIARHHRHHLPPVGALFAVAVAGPSGEVCGVATVGRPVARHLQDGWTAEVTRVATDGTPNACSALYGACWRAARALGWRRLITYTLDTEPGTSLRAAGWRCVGSAGGGNWSVPSRPRIDRHPLQGKLRWEADSDGHTPPARTRSRPGDTGDTAGVARGDIASEKQATGTAADAGANADVEVEDGNDRDRSRGVATAGAA